MIVVFLFLGGSFACLVVSGKQKGYYMLIALLVVGHVGWLL